MKTKYISLRFGLCCVCALSLATRVLAMPILLSDGRSLTTAASARTGAAQSSDNDAASPGTLFGAFMSSVSSDAATWGSGANATASQNSTVTPTSFDASGEISGHFGVSAEGLSSGGASAGVHASSVFSITFQLDGSYLYQGTGHTAGGAGLDCCGGGGGFFTGFIRLTDQNSNTVFARSGLGISESGLLGPGTYTLVSSISFSIGGMNPESGGGSGEYSWLMNLTPGPGVPDAGSTSVLLGSALVGLALLRRKLC
jgi:hypothetical protein